MSVLCHRRLSGFLGFIFSILTNDAQLCNAGDFADRISGDALVRAVVLRKDAGDRQSVLTGSGVGAQLEILGRLDDLVVVEPLDDRVWNADDATLELDRLALAHFAVLHRFDEARRRVALRRRRRLRRHRLTCDCAPLRTLIAPPEMYRFAR